jgi:hypothetical protein
MDVHTGGSMHRVVGAVANRTIFAGRESAAFRFVFFGQHRSEQGINERCDGRTFKRDDKNGNEQKNDNDGQDPQLFSLLRKFPEFLEYFHFTHASISC